MKKLCLLLLLAFSFLLPSPAPRAAGGPVAYVVEVKGVIGPATYELISRHLAAAAARNAAVVILEMHTPGGLYDSTQQIIQKIIDSPVPVVTYVSPAGSHAVSAGTYILYASHIAAMAPGTNIGAATPIQMNGGDDKKAPSTLESKMVNDAAAYIRTLGELRGRNLAFADKAVREAATITASEAVAQKVIDVVADDTDALLSKIDGKTVKMGHGKTMTLKTRGLKAERFEADWRTEMLKIISNPNIAFLLMTLATYGLIYEVTHPGAIFPGVAGAICLLLALYAMNVLPINYAGVLLIVLGIGLMTAEAFTPSFGILGIGGAFAFGGGAMMLIDSTTPGFGVDIWMAGLLALTSLGVLSVILAMAVRARRRQVVTGHEELLSARAEVLSWSRGRGEVRVTGEIWQAEGAGDFILKTGDRVRVTEIAGVTLKVAPEK